MATAHPLVHCNPFSALDHEGIPQGTFPFSPEHGAGSRRWVGATIASAVFDAKDLKGEKALPVTVIGKGTPQQRQEYVGRLPSQRTHFAFDLSPQPVLLDQHYRQGVATGDLFPADERSARLLGVPDGGFVDPKKRLDAARAAAVAAWKDQHGEEPDYTTWPENLRPPSATAKPSPAPDDPLPESPTASAPILAGDA